MTLSTEIRLVTALTDRCRGVGIELTYECRAECLLSDHAAVTGVIARHRGQPIRIDARAVILAAGRHPPLAATGNSA